MQISTTYLEWSTFRKLADGNFDENCRAYRNTGNGELPGELEVDEADGYSDSYRAWEEASEYLDAIVDSESPWRQFVEHAFLAALHGEPELRNDLGVTIDPEIFVAIFSPDSVREIMTPTIGQDIPWDDASSDEPDEITRWYNIWRKALERGLGIAYHLG